MHSNMADTCIICIVVIFCGRNNAFKFCNMESVLCFHKMKQQKFEKKTLLRTVYMFSQLQSHCTLSNISPHTLPTEILHIDGDRPRYLFPSICYTPIFRSDFFFLFWTYSKIQQCSLFFLPTPVFVVLKKNPYALEYTMKKMRKPHIKTMNHQSNTNKYYDLLHLMPSFYVFVKRSKCIMHQCRDPGR